MTTSWKCAECGLANFATAANCKRCDAVRPIPDAPPPPAGIVLEDGYVLPPPPSGGVWRDNKTLVMVKEALLPDRCVKCNAPANGIRLRRRLSWHHPVLYLIIFLALLIYAILAAALSKRATIEIGMCAEHFKNRRKKIAIGWIVLAGGLLLAPIAFANDYPLIGALGLTAFLFGLIWLIVVSRVVTPKKIDERLVWLNGVNSSYLAELPPWQGYA